MAAKKKAKKKTATKIAMLSPEELVAGLRRARGHLPTKASEAARRKKKGPSFE